MLRIVSPKPRPLTMALCGVMVPGPVWVIQYQSAVCQATDDSLLDPVRVVQQVDAERVAGRLVVEVPAQLDRAAAVVGVLPGRAAVRLARSQ